MLCRQVPFEQEWPPVTYTEPSMATAPHSALLSLKLASGIHSSLSGSKRSGRVVRPPTMDRPLFRDTRHIRDSTGSNGMTRTRVQSEYLHVNIDGLNDKG